MCSLFGKTTTDEITRSSSSGIQHVRLPDGTSNDDLAPIAESLHENTAVQTLYLTGRGLDIRDGGEIIRLLLLNNQSITKLNLAFNRQLGSEGATRLAQAPGNDRCVLKELILCGCRIGNEGMRQLCDALHHNNVLVKLDVGGNAIAFIGHAMAGDLIAAALQQNISLQELELDSCGLTGADLSCIFQSLARNNQTLFSLDICCNHMDEASYTELVRFLSDMKGLKELRFDWYEGVSMEVLQRVLHGLHGNDSLLRILTRFSELLQGEGPGLWATWSKYIAARNKMRPAVGGAVRLLPPVLLFLHHDLSRWVSGPIYCSGAMVAMKWKRPCFTLFYVLGPMMFLEWPRSK